MNLFSNLFTAWFPPKKPAKARIKIELVVQMDNQISFDFEGTQSEISALLLTAARCRPAFLMVMENSYSAFKLLMHEELMKAEHNERRNQFMNQSIN